MELPTPEQIIETIEKFLVRHGNMRPSRFGREATGDANFLSDLKGGAQPKLDRLHRIRDYMLAKDRDAGFAADDGAGADHVDGDTTRTAVTSPDKLRENIGASA